METIDLQDEVNEVICDLLKSGDRDKALAVLKSSTGTDQETADAFLSQIAGNLRANEASVMPKPPPEPMLPQPNLAQSASVSGASLPSPKIEAPKASWEEIKKEEEEMKAMAKEEVRLQMAKPESLVIGWSKRIWFTFFPTVPIWGMVMTGGGLIAGGVTGLVGYLLSRSIWHGPSNRYLSAFVCILMTVVSIALYLVAGALIPRFVDGSEPYFPAHAKYLEWTGRVAPGVVEQINQLRGDAMSEPESSDSL